MPLLGIAGGATLGTGNTKTKKLRNNNLTLDQLREIIIKMLMKEKIFKNLLEAEN